ncbi:MAG: hypothetical protein ACRD38_12775, partial [Nitrososphaerales archaeon]
MPDQKQEENEIFKPLLQKSGKGKIIYEDGFEGEVKFSLQLNQNGHTTGEMEFLNIKDPASLLKHFEGLNLFKIEGKDDAGDNLTAEQCLINRRTENWGETLTVKAEISTGKLVFPHKELD